MKHNNIPIIGAPKGKEKVQGIENQSEETMTENFPDLAKEIDTSPGNAESPKQESQPQRGPGGGFKAHLMGSHLPPTDDGGGAVPSERKAQGPLR